MIAARNIIAFGDPRLPVRFWDKVSPEPNSGCWLWTAGHARNGYGSFGIPRRPDKPRRSRNEGGHLMVVAHRYAYEALVGPIPGGLFLDHLCRVEPCVNPAHLEPVTNAENVRRGLKSALTPHCPSGHPYDDRNTQTRHHGHRRCATCNRERSERWRRDRQGSILVVGERVCWKSRSAEVIKGTVVALVQPGERPRTTHSARDHVSYVVVADDGKLHWPQVTLLRKEHDADLEVSL